MTEGVQRRLAAILAADVVGYTRLMGEDEAGTLRRFTELRQQVLEPLINEHRGRVVKLMGDGLLVEFASVEEVGIIHHCTDDLQAQLLERLREAMPNTKIHEVVYPPSLMAYLGSYMLGVVVFEGAIY